MASSDLTPVEEAIDHLVARARPITRSQTVALTNSLDRVLARDYTVPADVPPADNSAVDGYAVRAGDLAGGGTTASVWTHSCRRRTPDPQARNGCASVHRLGSTLRCGRGYHAGTGQRWRRRYHRQRACQRRPEYPSPWPGSGSGGAGIGGGHQDPPPGNGGCWAPLAWQTLRCTRN